MSGLENVTVGIDPGKGGAVAVIQNSDSSLIETFNFQTEEYGKAGKQRINAYALAGRLNQISDKFFIEAVWIEKVGAMPKQGVTSSFNFGESAGVIRGVCCALMLPVAYVTPQRWKGHFAITGHPKDVARDLVNERWPSAGLKLKKDVDRADAALIALYGSGEAITPL